MNLAKALPCPVLKKDSTKNSPTINVYVLDGYCTFIERDAKLDVCHGRTSWVIFVSGLQLNKFLSNYID